VIVKTYEAPETDMVDVADTAATPLQAMFDEAACSALAGPAAFLRGVSLALHGAVSDLRLRPDSASGSVSSEVASADDASVGAGVAYEVRLLALLDQADRAAGSSYTCSCTRGSGGALCAHAVAVALVATGSVDPDHDPDAPYAVDGELADVDSDIDPVAVQEFLLALSRAELVDLVLDLAEVNDGLADDLRATAARWHRPAADA
jgi:hypothetical protein